MVYFVRNVLKIYRKHRVLGNQYLVFHDSSVKVRVRVYEGFEVGPKVARWLAKTTYICICIWFTGMTIGVGQEHEYLGRLVPEACMMAGLAPLFLDCIRPIFVWSTAWMPQRMLY